jgi:hypothetical protein
MAKEQKAGHRAAQVVEDLESCADRVIVAQASAGRGIEALRQELSGSAKVAYGDPFREVLGYQRPGCHQFHVSSYRTLVGYFCRRLPVAAENKGHTAHLLCRDAASHVPEVHAEVTAQYGSAKLAAP